MMEEIPKDPAAPECATPTTPPRENEEVEPVLTNEELADIAEEEG